mgnify:CR=1 FL=1
MRLRYWSQRGGICSKPASTLRRFPSAKLAVWYFKEEKHRQLIENLLKELTIEAEKIEEENQILAGKSFAITGSLNHFENRNQLKEKIESLGGKVTGSVTGKTFALINNDAASNSSKNKKARELGVEIITESEFLGRYVNG